MVNKIKAIFAAISFIVVLMLVSNAFFWALIHFPNRLLEFFIVSSFAYCGCRAYSYFLEKFNKGSKDKQINS